MREGKYLYTCHNCGVTCSVQNLLKRVNPIIYHEYLQEKLLESGKRPEKIPEIKTTPPVFPKNSVLKKGPKKVNELPDNHPCKQYVIKRQIPSFWYHKLYYAPKFMTWVNTVIPDKFDDKALALDEPRLIIPFLNKDKMIYGFQGRSLKPHAEVKYISIILNDDYPKLFGLDTVDTDRRHYLFEGPIDSMFIPNSCAVCGGELLHVANYLNPENLVLVFDNEPRNKDVCKKMERAINLNFNVCIWPPHMLEKDVNELILPTSTRYGHSPFFIRKLIDDNTWRGLQASLQFGIWRRC